MNTDNYQLHAADHKPELPFFQSPQVIHFIHIFDTWIKSGCAIASARQIRRGLIPSAEISDSHRRVSRFLIPLRTAVGQESAWAPGSRGRIIRQSLCRTARASKSLAEGIAA